MVWQLKRNDFQNGEKSFNKPLHLSRILRDFLKKIYFFTIVLFLITLNFYSYAAEKIVSTEQIFIPEELLNVLHRIPLPQSDVCSIKKLESYTNSNYLIETKEKKIIVRIPGRFSDLYIDRKDEYKNSLIAKKNGFNPIQLLFFDLDDGLQVADFLDQALFYEDIDIEKNASIEKIAEFFSNLHSQKFNFENNFNPCSRIKILYEQYRKLCGKECMEFKKSLRWLNDIEELLQKDIFQHVPCHNDPVPSNIVFINQVAKLIDWEYSGNNDPAWDVAYFLTIANFSEAQIKLFLNNYTAFDRDEIQEKVVFFQPIIHLTIGIWALFETLVCPKNRFEFFQELSKQQFKIYKTKVSSPEFNFILTKYRSIN